MATLSKARNRISRLMKSRRRVSAFAYWDAEPLNAAAVISMVEQAPTTKVALCIESFSNTPVSAIRRAVGLSQVEAKNAAPAELAA